MNCNIKDAELIFTNVIGTITIGRDGFNLIESEESKSVADYCKIISENMQEISSMVKEIQELKEKGKECDEKIKELEKELSGINKFNEEAANEMENFYEEKIKELEKKINELQYYSNLPEEEEEEELFDDYESIPEVAAPLEIIEVEPEVVPEIIVPSVTLNEKEKSSQGNSITLKPLVIPKIELKADNSGILAQIETPITDKFLKSFKPEKPVKPIPEAKAKQIEEGIIKFFKSRGKKTSFRYNYSEKSKSDAKKEAKEIQALCGVKEHRCICQVFKSLLSSGRIMEVGTQKKTESGAGGRFTLYSLNDLEYSKPKSRCSKCGGFSLVRNENKYSSDEDYYHDKNGYYFTCMLCGEEVVVEEKEAA